MHTFGGPHQLPSTETVSSAPPIFSRELSDLKCIHFPLFPYDRQIAIIPSDPSHHSVHAKFPVCFSFPNVWIIYTSFKHFPKLKTSVRHLRAPYSPLASSFLSYHVQASQSLLQGLTPHCPTPTSLLSHTSYYCYSASYGFLSKDYFPQILSFYSPPTCFGHCVQSQHPDSSFKAPIKMYFCDSYHINSNSLENGLLGGWQ